MARSKRKQVKSNTVLGSSSQKQPTYIGTPTSKWYGVLPPDSVLEDEAPNEHIPVEKRDLSFWLVFFLVVVPVYSITPVSWAYVIWWTCRSLASKMKTETTETIMKRWEWILLLYTVFESAFSIYYQVIARIIRNRKSSVPPRETAYVLGIWNRVLQAGLGSSLQDSSSPPESITTLDEYDPRAIDFRFYLRKWFWNEPWKNITRKSASDWVAFLTFDKNFNELGLMEQVVVAESLSLLEKRAGRRFPTEREDRHEDIVPIKLTLVPVNIWSRPAVAYIVPELGNFATRWWLQQKYGMKFGIHNGIEYLLRPARPRSKAREPVVFMHGVGVGMIQYVVTVARFLGSLPTDQPVLIPLQAHISATLFHPRHLEPHSRADWVDGLKDLFEFLGWSGGVTMVSHSNGSLTHSWMLQTYPHLIKRSCFCDPVVFCLWEGAVAYNFIYKRPYNGLTLFMRYFVATELGTANTVQRHFDWCANALWIDQIPHAQDPYYATFFLGGQDTIVDSKRVRQWLLSHGVEDGIHWDEWGRHGQAVLHPGKGQGLDQLEEWLLMTASRKQKKRL